MIEAIVDGVRITVHVSPGAATTRCAGRHGDALKLRLAAPPIDGRANEALLVFVTGALGVPRRNATLVRGHAARRKVVDVIGVTLDGARAAFAESG